MSAGQGARGRVTNTVKAVGSIEDAVEFIVRGGGHGDLSFFRCPDT